VLCWMERCDRKLSRPIWSSMWISSDDRGWCHDLNWGELWNGTDVKECSHDLIRTDMFIGKMWHEAFWKNLKDYVD
jgi:hypothetical protein